MIWSAATGQIHKTRDCIFEEDFTSTLAYTENQFSGYLRMLNTDAEPDYGVPFHEVVIFASEDINMDGLFFHVPDENGILEEIRDWHMSSG
jgi:hypothetical protein